MRFLEVAIRQGKGGYEGSVTIPGLKPTKLARKDGSTSFPTTSALKTVARGVALRLGLVTRYTEPKKTATKKTSVVIPTNGETAVSST